jgi:integrase/recombinase XerD
VSRASIPQQDPRRRCMPPREWPAADQVAWAEARAPGNILQPGGRASHWRPSSLAAAEHDWGRFLTFLDLDGKLDPAASPAARATRENVESYITALQALNAPVTVSTRVNGLFGMLCVLAPHDDFVWLDRIGISLAARAVPSRNKAARVVPASELVELGFALMKRANRAAAPVERAFLHQVGLMIALLAHAPMRRGNFASIEIGRHLIKIGDSYRLVFPGEEMKNHERFEAPVPECLNQAVERHLGADRPTLAARTGTIRAQRRPPGNALWISRFGSAFHASRIYENIREVTKAHFGHAINLHLFRDCVATTIANDDPANIGITRPILSHRSDAAAQKYYNQAKMAEAVRMHQALVCEMRSGAAKPKRKGSAARIATKVTQSKPPSRWQSKARKGGGREGPPQS